MSRFDYDLYVIGAGSGGVRGSRIAAGFGARVGVCEEYRYGGTCVIRGCVPKKLFVYASAFSEAFEDAAGYGWTVGESTFDWATLIANKDREIDRLEGVYQRLLGNAGVEMHRGRGVLEDAHTIAVGDRRFTAERIMIATGGAPTKPEIPGAEHAITSNDAFHLAALPQRICVYGGGYIALEFACIFHGLGVDTTVVYRKDRVLRGFDDDVRVAVQEAMAEKGIRMILDTTIEAVEKDSSGKTVVLSSGERLSVDEVMFGTGRAPNTAGLGLEAIGVEMDGGGAVKVDAYSRTSVDHIFAVGDVTDRIQLTPVALMEGQAVAHTLFNDNPTTVDHGHVASAVFTQPEVATVGMTEAEAREAYEEIRVYRSTFRPMKYTLPDRQEKSLFKIIVDDATDRVVGVHLVGPYSGEMMQGVAVAVKMGATKADFDRTIGIHPTSAEELVTMRTPVTE
ncbi:MAG: glutathione-disulfide reductase [Pseudomonadota bacterium]